MPNQYSPNRSLMHQSRHRHLLWATCFHFSTWPRPSQQVSFAGRAHLTGPGLREPSPGGLQTGLGLVTSLAAEIEGQAQGGSDREQ